MGGWRGDSRHVGRQGYGHVVEFSIRVGHDSDRVFEEGDKLLEVGLAWIVAGEREGDPGAVLYDRLLCTERGSPVHVPYFTVWSDVELVVEAQTVEPMARLPFVTALGGDAECPWAGTVEYAGEPWWNLALNLELYGFWLLNCVVETIREQRLELLRFLGHGKRRRGGD